MQYFTFSWGGNYIAIRGFLRALGHSLATPTAVSQEAIKKGTALGHPFLCYSYKIVLGQVQEQLEAGQRNFVFMSSLSAEACRCADAGRLMELLFKDRYPGFRAIRLGGNLPDESLANLAQHFPGVSRRRHNYAYMIFYAKLELLYAIGRTCLRLRSLAENPAEVRALEAGFTQRVDHHNHPLSLFWTGMQFERQARKIRLIKEEPAVRVGITGGEHILSELDSIMAKIKDRAEQGVYMEWRGGFRFLARASCYASPLKGKEGLPYMRALCRRYLHPAAQTSEVLSCAHALEFAEEGFDGIIHIYSMGCMPQTALKPALKRISRETSVPILELGLGEKFNEAGIETRLDAFVDLLQQKKAQQAMSAVPCGVEEA